MFWVVYAIVTILYIFGVLWWSVKDIEGRTMFPDVVSVFVVLGFIPVVNIFLLVIITLTGAIKYLRRKYR